VTVADRCPPSRVARMWHGNRVRLGLIRTLSRVTHAGGPKPPLTPTHLVATSGVPATPVEGTETVFHASGVTAIRSMTTQPRRC
jgi:hypothetical protein